MAAALNPPYSARPAWPDPVEARRARLLRFVKRFVAGDPDCPTFRLRLGLAPMKWECLTDEALETVASDMVADFWFHRKINRANRALWARNAAAAASAPC